MENTDFIERIAHLEERNKSNTKRIDEHDERIEKLENTYSTLQKMDYRIGKLETTIEKMDNKLDSKINQDSENKGKKWDKLLDYLFYSVIAILLTLLYSKLGLKP